MLLAQRALSSTGARRMLLRHQCHAGGQLARIGGRGGRLGPAQRCAAAAAAPPAEAELSTAAAAGGDGAAAGHARAAAAAPAYKVPLDFKFIRDNVDLVAANAAARNAACDAALVAALYDEWLAAKAHAETLRAERNENAAAMKVRAALGARDAAPATARPAGGAGSGCGRQAGGRPPGLGQMEAAAARD